MKKFKMLAACLVLTLSLSALTACGTSRNNTKNPGSPFTKRPYPEISHPLSCTVIRCVTVIIVLRYNVLNKSALGRDMEKFRSVFR